MGLSSGTKGTWTSNVAVLASTPANSLPQELTLKVTCASRMTDRVVETMIDYGKNSLIEL